jgi:putative N6-adenine-specific DNA methylase
MTELLADEMRELGGHDVKTSYRVVYFTATESEFYGVHLKSRLASRVFRIVKDMPASSPRIVFDKVRRIQFGKVFSPQLPVKIQVSSVRKNDDFPTHLIGSKIREAMTDSFQHFDKQSPNLSSRDPKVSVRGFVHGRRLMLSLDTSLNSLHKRGYRTEGHPAPLKETLASALLRVIGYDGSQALYDPMCGSGSIIIEGAQIAINKAPLIHRKKGEFGFEHLKDFDSRLWQSVQDEARRAQHKPLAPLFAGDIDPKYVEIARTSALKARVEKYISFKSADFFKSTKPTDQGIMIANIPYGMRLDEETIDKAYLAKLGDHLKAAYKGWRCGILLPEESAYKHIGLKTTCRYSFLNGSVKVKFLIFDMY